MGERRRAAAAAKATSSLSAAQAEEEDWWVSSKGPAAQAARSQNPEATRLARSIREAGWTARQVPHPSKYEKVDI